MRSSENADETAEVAPAAARQPAVGSSSSLPVVRRACMSVCACAASASGRSRSSSALTPRSTPRPRAWPTVWSRPTRAAGRRRVRDGRGRGLRAVAQGARAVRARRRLRQRLGRAEHGRDRPADAALGGRRRLLADAPRRAPRDGRGAARRPLRAGGAGRAARRRRARRYPLAEAAQAHTDMQARRTTGKLLLDPTAA